MGDHPYHHDDSPDWEEDATPEEAAPLGDDQFPPGDDRLPPVSDDLHDMPTREIARLDADELEDLLAETRLSPTIPPDLPLEDTPPADDFFPQEPSALDDPGATVVNAALNSDADETQLSSLIGRDPTPPTRTSAVPPTRSYSETPVVPPPPEQPPVYGSLNDYPRPTPAASAGPPPPRDRRKRGRTARERRDSGLYFPWWTLLLLLAGVALVAALIFVGLGALGGQFSPGGETPVVIVVTSTPTRRPTRPPVTPTPRLPTATATSALATAAVVGETAESVITPDPVQFEVRIGAEIEIFDVGTAGLNVRQGAGTEFPVVLIAAEGTRFEVIGGPEDAAGFTWWQLRNVDDPTIEGWGVAEFLRVPAE